MRYKRRHDTDAPTIKRNGLNDVSEVDINQSIANAIKRQIKLHNDDQKELALEFGIPYTTFNGYVNGTSNVPAYLVARVADKYDLSTDDLIFPEGTTNTKQLKLDNNDTQLMLESLAIFLLISDFQWHDIIPGTPENPRPISTEPPMRDVYCYYGPDKKAEEAIQKKKENNAAKKKELYEMYPQMKEIDELLEDLHSTIVADSSGPHANAIMCSDYDDDDFLHWHFILESFMGITRIDGLNNSEKFDFMKKAIAANIESHGFAKNYDWGFHASID